MMVMPTPPIRRRVFLGRLNKLYGIAGKAEPGKAYRNHIWFHSRLSGRMRRRSMSVQSFAIGRRRDIKMAIRHPERDADGIGSGRLQYLQGQKRSRSPMIIASAIRSDCAKAPAPSNCSSAKAEARSIQSQRADVAGFRTDMEAAIRPAALSSKCRRGTPNQFAASQAGREVNSILTASGMPPQTVAMRSYQPESPAQLPTVRLSYSAIKADAGPCGSVADRSRAGA